MLYAPAAAGSTAGGSSAPGDCPIDRAQLAAGTGQLTFCEARTLFMQALRVLELVLLDHTQRVGRVKVDTLPLCHRSLFRRPHGTTTD